MAKRITKEKWIKWQVKDFDKRIASNYSETFKNDIRMPFTHTYGNYQIIITKRLDMIILNTLTGKSSMIRNCYDSCNEYIKRNGLEILFAYAWAKYCKRPIPEFIERIDTWDLKTGDIIYLSSSISVEPTIKESNKYVYLKPYEKASILVYDLESDRARKINSSIYKFYKEIDE